MDKLFANPTEFALFIERAVAVELFADTAGRAQVALKIVEHTKDRIGNAEQLPPPLAPSTVKEREELGFDPEATLLRTGELRESYHMGHISKRKTVAGSDDPRALIHELGVTDAGRNHDTVIPARFPLTRSFHDHEGELFELFLGTFAGLFEPR